jgi:hypothetical protein
MKRHLALALLVLFSVNSAPRGRAPAAPQKEPDPSPYLHRADLPLYPPVAWAAHITGTVKIRVTVANGTVVDAQPEELERTDQALLYLVNASLANVKTWQFESQVNTTFVVTYVYKIQGKYSPQNSNPKIELVLPNLVKITATPYKATTL